MTDQKHDAEQNDSGTPLEHVNMMSTSIRLNDRQFHDTSIEYATLSHVAFDTTNYHLVFFVTSPTEAVLSGDPDPEALQARTVVRLALPPSAAVTVYAQLRDALSTRLDLDSIQFPLASNPVDPEDSRDS